MNSSENKKSVSKKRFYPSKLLCDCCGRERDNLDKKHLLLNPNKEKLSKQVVWIEFNKSFICKACSDQCNEDSILCSLYKNQKTKGLPTAKRHHKGNLTNEMLLNPRKYGHLILVKEENYLENKLLNEFPNNLELKKERIDISTLNLENPFENIMIKENLIENDFKNKKQVSDQLDALLDKSFRTPRKKINHELCSKLFSIDLYDENVNETIDETEFEIYDEEENNTSEEDDNDWYALKEELDFEGIYPGDEEKIDNELKQSKFKSHDEVVCELKRILVTKRYYKNDPIEDPFKF